MVLRMLRKLVSNESGLSPVEYVLVAAIITVITTFAVSAAGFTIMDILPG